MNNRQQFIITVRYPEWEQLGNTYPPFGLRYLFETNVIQLPDWDEDDPRWFSWSEDKVVRDRFKVWWRKHIGKNGETFNGDILFVEPSNLVLCDGRSGAF